ncbi:MAG: aconitate hydratase [Lentisphaerae bacterium]|nr:aconitate hydratase [Lentisphaerota bacterium]
MPGKSLVTKILAEHLVEGELTPGREIKIRIDQTLCQDATGTMAFLELEAMGVDRVRTELSVQYVDHNTNQMGPENQNDHLYLQSICRAKGVWFSRPGNGICHQVHLERFGVPGKTLLGSDSHTPTNGGMGMLAIGAGGLDVAVAMAGGPFKLTCPRVVGVRLSGRLGPWVASKDIILKVLSILGSKGNVGTAVEYFGPGVATLTVPERATVTNMGAELGVTASVFPSDEQTRRYLAAQGREASWRPLAADDDAAYDRVIEIDLSALEPLVACPSNPANIKAVREVAGLPVNQVVIGSCTNSSYRDLALVAAVLDGRVVHPDISLGIAPGSRQVMQMLSRDGLLDKLIAAGARLLESACGPCIGQGFSPANDTVTVRTFNRNFAGRTGTRQDQCYLVSPETAVATALTGVLTDPRTLGIACPSPAAPARFLIDDRMILAPAAPGEAAPIIRKETIGEPPRCAALPAALEGTVLLKVGDKITTDHIMPAGAYLKYRSNIPRYAQVVFECFNEEGKPTFAERAAALRDAGGAGVILAGESYGQGSSREHAAICPMFLGVRAVVAISIERIHAANLVNFGILPLLLADRADYERIGAGDRLVIAGLATQLAPGKAIAATVLRADGSRSPVALTHTLSDEDIAMVLKGGRLA